MATFDAEFNPHTFDQMEARGKTVYAVIAAGDLQVVCSGDRIEFGERGSITIGAVRRYPDLEALVAGEGLSSLDPDAETAEAAITRLRADPEWEAALEQSKGVLALRVREVRRKP